MWDRIRRFFWALCTFFSPYLESLFCNYVTFFSFSFLAFTLQPLDVYPSDLGELMAVHKSFLLLFLSFPDHSMLA